MRTLDLVQGEERWHAHRCSARNASDAPAIMGASPYVTRAELIRRKATGIVPDVDAATQRVFDRGHEVEPALVAFVESIIGETLYPIIGLSDDGYLSASFDGVTIAENILCEAKQPNAGKMADVRNDVIPVADYWQIVQQFAVCEGAGICYYVVGDGTPENTVFMVIPRSRISADIPKLRATWVQNDADVADYKPEAVAVEVVAAPIEGFGVLALRVEGRVLASNLDQFKADADAFLHRLPKASELQTDQDFADADNAAKACADAESRIKAACDAAVGQMADVDSILRTAKHIGETIRTARLALEKAVSAEKENRRADTIAHYVKQVGEHYAAINRTLGEYAICVPHTLSASIAAAAKGKRTLLSIAGACDTAAASAKVEANIKAETIRQNIALIADVLPESAGLFPDRVQLAHTLRPEDLRDRISLRLMQQQQQEAAKLEAAKARQAREEAAKEEAGNVHSVAPAPTSAGTAFAGTARSAATGAASDDTRRIRLGQINEAIFPLSTTVEGLASLGFQPVGKERAATMYAESDFYAIRDAITAHIATAELRKEAA